MTEPRAALGRRFQSILETIGATPVVKINRLSPEGVDLFVKAEFFNPGASVKDRLALSIIEHGERTGALKPGQTVIEATSGNTGIGLAMVCAAKGYPFVCTMIETFSIERRKLMRYLGAKVILTPKEEKGVGMVRKAKELAEANGWFLARQFETEANADIHEKTTGPEILADFDGHRLDAFVTGFGTGGTVTGVARVLRQHRPDTKIILSEPDTAQMLASGTPQERATDGSAAATHPAWSPHPIQGWSPDFIPLVLQESIDKKLYDALIPVKGEDGIHWAKRLAAEEGILTGISGGSTFAVAHDLAQQAEIGSAILCMLPDTAERYLSTPLFADISAEMNDEEVAIFNGPII
ncbi:Cysteine synthase [Parvularcula bermudensis HTCC2503]|uniref:Cysteine synthase n=1 Tax=Parvularcula bermudensis (strain ATCC BAA-594 / HTCC2503 / KCTC 12087) TaxID=314260 RepID=E0TG53_PARBH|nr:cysteine synthase A [Parvularcula bermudensis]ADM10624.1 Cysteine synthase [Parvularcula bermudensis HTCC2503]